MNIVPPMNDPFPSSFVSFFFWHTLQVTSSKQASSNILLNGWLPACLLPPSDARIWGKSMWELDSLPHTFHKYDMIL
jgi:hypothetical protein